MAMQRDMPGAVQGVETQPHPARALRLGQLQVLEMIASGRALEDTLAALCELIEQQEEGLLCSILLLDASGRHTGGGVGHSLPRSFLDALEGICIEPPHVGSCCHALDTGDEIVVCDVEHDGPWAAVWREVNLRHGLRSCRSIPVKGDNGSVLASVAVFRREVGDPGPKDRTLLDIATHLAGLAIERHSSARRQLELQRAASRALRRTELLLEAAAILLAAEDLDAMLRQVFARIAPHFQLDAYFNYMVAEPGDRLQLASCAGIDDNLSEALRHLAFGQAVCGLAAARGETIAREDIASSEAPEVQLVRSLGIRAYVAHPLVGSGRLLGTLSFASRRRDRFEPDELEFFETICRYAAAAYERLHLIEQLRLGDRRKNEFLATLSHELRNPLAPMSQALQLLSRANGNTDTTAKAVSVLQRQLRLLIRLVDDLLDLSRIASGRLDLRRTDFDLVTAARQAVEQSQPLMESQGHRFDFSAPAAPLQLEGDADRITQVIANLLNNAARYTPPGGQIELTVRREDALAVVTVRDSGIGIPAVMMDRIFNMFAQVDPGAPHSKSGMGIGLALARGIVGLHGGTIRAHSTGLGSGAVFEVQLPLPAAGLARPL